MKVGVSLSGGGVRALVFHLGVLKRIAESKHWDSIAHLSTVSGGSLCVALIFAKSGGKWPDSESFINSVLPSAKDQLTKHSLILASVCAGFAKPWRLLNGRAHLVAHALSKKWGATMSLQDLPERPRWTINCTTYETGKNWRFSHKRMGDYLTGYVLNPDFPVADAAAASAGFPGGIGPRKLRTSDYKWVDYKMGSREETESIEPRHKQYHLWDGGVYENLGSEALLKPGKGLRDDIDFYIASDAGKPMAIEPRRGIFRPALRLLDCAMDQVRAVRARTIHGMIKPKPPGQTIGIYIQMGLDRNEIYRLSKTSEVCPLTGPCNLTPEDAKFVARFPTTLRKLQASDYDLILNHGYEVADSTMNAWIPSLFKIDPLPQGGSMA